MHHNHEKIQDCIQTAWQCRATCQETLFNYCLQEGGEHTEQDHLKLMMDCIEICQAAADFMTRHSQLHAPVCAACADVCEACAESCEAIDDNQMKQCAEISRRCAKSCREMSGSTARKAA